MDNSSRQRILEATIAAIDKGGETAVRIIEVAEAAGVTQGLVTYHFRTRDQLIAEANTARFVATINEDLSTMSKALETMQSREDLIALTQYLTKLLLTPERAGARKRRLNALGFAIQSPHAREAIRETQTEIVDGMTNLIRVAQERGLARQDIDARAMATVVLSYAFGLVITEFDAHPPSEKDLYNAVLAFITTLVLNKK